MKKHNIPKLLVPRFVGALTAICVVLASGVNAPGQGTITFNGAAGLASTYYQERGMWFQVMVPPGTSGVDVMGITFGADNTPRNGSPFMGWARLHNPYDFVEMYLINRSTFGLTSVQLADPVNPSLSPVAISFVGYPATGPAVTFTFSAGGGGTSVFADCTFGSSFASGLTRVDILAPRWAMDNLVFTIPEPAAGSLLALGLLALALARRKPRP